MYIALSRVVTVHLLRPPTPRCSMQKALSELNSLSGDDLSRLLDGLGEPLLVTTDGEPIFVAQSLEGFEPMVRRLRILETEREPNFRNRMRNSIESSGRRGKL